MPESLPFTILNVDDQAAGLYAKSRILRQAGFTVLEASTGQEALRLVAAEKPVLVLLDVKLPDINGLEVCRRLKTDPATAATLVLQISAALGEAQDRVRGLESGADGYLVDPIAPAELAATVKALIRLWQREQENRQLLGRLQQEISERKQVQAALQASEARLRAIVHAVPDVLLVLDEEGRYLEILTAQPPLLYTDPTALTGKLIRDVLPAEVAHVGLRAIRQTLLTRQPQRFEYTLSIEKAGQRSFEARTAPLNGLPGKPAVVLLARDVTQQRLTEASLRQAQKLEAVGQLTGGMAHDFNNLLAVILGNLELLAEEIHEPALASLVQRALEATERGAELIRRLLTFARKQPLQTKAVDLNRLVRGMVELLQRTLGETIQVETVLAEELAPTVIDPGQFETALLNVAINARDAMPQGGRLTIETANRALEEDYARTQLYQVLAGPYVLLAVSDTGCGMPPEVVEHAVEPFFTTKAVGQGSGLGLSMVYGLVKQSGGHLQLYSEVGQGTTVRMYLPAVPLPTDAPRAAPPGEVPLPTDAPRAAPPGEVLLPTGQGQLILVVEDEAPVRRLAVHLLQSLGYQTLEAETAATALAALAATPAVALLFTDVVLPGGMSGVELAHEARRRRPDLKVLFTSGYTEAHLTRFSRPLTGSDLLSKPYRKAPLADKLHALLGQGSSSGN